MKSGLYTAKGTTTCAGFAASCGHEMQDAAQWAEWGIDYCKDDSCSSCGSMTDNELYHGMWLAIQASGREMVLTIEGNPDNSLGSAGGLGNAKRVGHDINPHWNSMTSLVDIGSGLWMYAHNSTNATYGGWWNDLDMIEVGVGEDFNCTINLAQCQAHFTMWTIMKAPLILGNNIPLESSATFGVVSNAQAIAVNQDPLGLQARRVLVFPPSNTSLTTGQGTLAVLGLCNASRPTQTWAIFNTSAHQASHSKLYTAPCSAGDPYQQWSFAGGAMRNLGSGACIDRSAGSDPATLAPCASPLPPSQAWALSPTSGHIASSGGACLDVYDFSGPDVFIGGCKAPGAADSNQVFASLPGGLLRSASTGLPANTCLVASDGPVGLLLSTADAEGVTWCLSSAFGGEGGMTAVPCTPGDGKAGPSLFSLTPRAGAPGQYSLKDVRGGGVNYNNQVGASGPWPGTRYISSNSWDASGAALTLNPAQPGPIAASDTTGIINDNLVGGVSTGGEFCLDLVTGGMLEVWVGPLSGARFAVALFNRSPGPDSITLPFQALNLTAGTSMRVFDIWREWQGRGGAAQSAQRPQHHSQHSTPTHSLLGREL